MNGALHEALRELEGSEVALGQSLELGGVAAREGEDLVDVYADDVLGVDAPEDRRDDRAGVVAVGSVALVAEPTHQLGPRVRDPRGVPAGCIRGAGETEAGNVRDHHVERRRRIAAMGARIGERADQVDVLDKRVRPPVREDQRCGVRLGRPDVDEVDRLAVDRRRELRERVELRLDGSPVELGTPALDELLEVAAGHAVLPAGLDRSAGRQAFELRRRQLVGPAGSREPGHEVVDAALRDVDTKRTDLGVVGVRHDVMVAPN